MSPMQADVARDYVWQRARLPLVKRILGQVLIVEAPWQEDQERNTDLIVLTMAAVRIAVRIRRYDPYALQYPDEITMRDGRPSGVRVELAKVISGFGDYFFYGFEDPADSRGLSGWVVGDLKVFRLWLADHLVATGRMPGIQKPNGDGTTFRAFRLADLPDEFVLTRRRVRTP